MKVVHNMQKIKQLLDKQNLPSVMDGKSLLVNPSNLPTTKPKKKSILNLKSLDELYLENAIRERDKKAETINPADQIKQAREKEQARINKIKQHRKFRETVDTNRIAPTQVQAMALIKANVDEQAEDVIYAVDMYEKYIEAVTELTRLADKALPIYAATAPSIKQARKICNAWAKQALLNFAKVEKAMDELEKEGYNFEKIRMVDMYGVKKQVWRKLLRKYVRNAFIRLKKATV